MPLWCLCHREGAGVTDRHHAQSPESANAAGKNGKEKPAQLGFMWGNRYCSMSSWMRLPGTCTATCNTQRKPRALSQLPRVHPAASRYSPSSSRNCVQQAYSAAAGPQRAKALRTRRDWSSPESSPLETEIRGATGSEAGTGAGPSRQWHWSHRMTDTSLVYRDPSSPIRDRGCPAFRRV